MAEKIQSIDKRVGQENAKILTGNKTSNHAIAVAVRIKIYATSKHRSFLVLVV